MSFVGSSVVTPQMKEAHLARLSIHRHLVRKYSRILNSEVDGNLVEECKYHDASKRTEPEFNAYACINWSHVVDDYEPPEICKKATLYHITNNSHHPEYHSEEEIELSSWQDDEQNRGMKSESPVTAIKMPEVDLAHMVCDWASMSEELGGTVEEWARDNIDSRWEFDNDQIKFILSLIETLEGTPAMDENYSLNLTVDMLLPEEFSDGSLL